MSTQTEGQNPNGCCWDPPHVSCCTDITLPEKFRADFDGQQGCGFINHHNQDLIWDGESKWVGHHPNGSHPMKYELYCVPDGTSNIWKVDVHCDGENVGTMEFLPYNNCNSTTFLLENASGLTLHGKCGCDENSQVAELYCHEIKPI